MGKPKASEKSKQVYRLVIIFGHVYLRYSETKVKAFTKNVLKMLSATSILIQPKNSILICILTFIVQI